MKTWHKTMLALAVTAAASLSAHASSDMGSCPWGYEGCFLASPPVLDTSNDSRDNLLRLTGEKHAFTPLRQPVPDDITRSRSYYFGPHIDEWYNADAPDEETASPLAETAFDERLKALNLSADEINDNTFRGDDASGRFISNSPESASALFAALLADTSLTPDQRTTLARARLAVPGGAELQTMLSELPYAEGSAAAFRDYLLAADHFYQGDYAPAAAIFTRLKDSPQPWLAETATYMLMRTALNQSTANASGEYGEFMVLKVDKAAADRAQAWAESYLQRWPEGTYATSTRGLMRRISWYRQDWDRLAALYEQAFAQAQSGEALVALIAENDSKLQSKDLSGYDDFFISAPDAPLITFTQTLRLMRATECDDNAPCVDDAFLQAIKPIFDNSGKPELWRYLSLRHQYAQKAYPAVVSAIKPAESLPASDILLFSEQALYGEALMAQKQWPAARSHWLHLLGLSKDFEQQQYLQAKLAATELESGNVDAVFAADSAVTSLRYRSLVLKTKASADLLRQQVINGPNSEERTIALHTLLMKDLIDGRYGEWLTDKKLASHISRPVIDEAFSDVSLTVFDWNGKQTEQGYYCAALANTVTVLAKNPGDAHALNCLGEFFRTTQARVNSWKEAEGNDALSSAVADALDNGKPDRQRYYQQIITDNKAEVEDKAYALYRAVRCYAPSGYNDCGGEEVDKRKRKGWFTQLKTQYPGSPWAQKLDYYW